MNLDFEVFQTFHLTPFEVITDSIFANISAFIQLQEKMRIILLLGNKS